MTAENRKTKVQAALKTLLFLSLAWGAMQLLAAQEIQRHGGGYAATGQMPQADYTAEIYDATNGLPTSDANFIHASKDGYIWICGYSGVFRYDGSVFEKLPTSFGLTSGRGLFEDSKNRLWVGTNDNGVVLLEDEKSRHYTYKDGLPSSSIRIFAEDAEGNVFIGTTSGVAYVDAQGRLHALSDERINEERILKLDSDKSGRIYGQTKNGIVFAIENCKVTELYSSSELGMEKITTLMADPLNIGKVYLCTESSTVYYGYLGKNASHMKKIPVAPLKDVHWISYDCGRIWLSSTTMAGYLDETEQFRVLTNIPLNSSIEMTTSDYQGNIWAASATQGVMKIITNNFVNLTRKSGLKKETTNVTCFHDGMLYIGTDAGLRILDKEHKPVENELTGYLGSSRIRCIIEDKKGNVWIATYTGGIGLVCQGRDGRITAYSTKNGLLNNEIRCIYEGRDGSILAGTNGGLAILKDGKVIQTFGAADGIRNTVFLTVAEDDDGNIYCGSDGDGIYVISGSAVKRIGRDEGLTSDVVMRIKKDAKRNLYWIVTSNSIEYMKDGMIKSIHSFPYNNNYDLYTNDKDECWILSSYGVYVVKADELAADAVKDYRLYTIANGLPYSITSNSYSALDEGGNLFISGREGVIRVNINHFFDANAQVKVDINYIYCDDEKIFQNADGSYTLPASNGRIKLTASVLDYTLTNPLVRVFLEGSGDAGITARRNELSALEYTGLSCGNYTLHIQILGNNKNVLLDKTFSIIKKPQLTELFFVRLLILVFLLVSGGFIVWRFMKLTVLSRQYEEIRQAKEESERANTAKARFLSNMSQEILTPINTIMGMDEMIMREESKNVPKSYFMSIMNYAFGIWSASESLLGLVNDLLEMTKIETGRLQLVQQEYDVQETLRSIIAPVRKRSTEKGLAFDIVIDEMLPRRLYGDVGKIRQVVSKLLSNAVKHTDNGGFVLKLSMENRTDNVCGLCFSVKDTGIGIRQEDVEGLFTAYSTSSAEGGEAPHVKTVLGLDVSRKFAELMGGVLVCRSSYGEGSEFIFTLTQKIVDATPLGTFLEQDSGEVARGPYIPQFIAPDADVLVADANPMNLNVMRNLLKATRVFITTASNGEECLEKIKMTSFNIAFIDQLLLKTSGEDFIEKIREASPELPVYVITENAATGEEAYKARGFNGCLSNPVDSMLLERIIMRHLPEQMMEKPTKGDFAEELKEIPEHLLWLRQIEGLSVEEGIKASGGIGGLIFGLQLFFDTIEENAKVIDGAYRNGDFKLYEMKVSLLKNSARLIGAVALYEHAAKLEDACKRDDRIFIGAHTDALLECYTAFKEKLARLGGMKNDV